ncbi:MAG: phosphatidylserine/phosphatidylglycerophosphate/cardiolipin synthase family protein [Pseudomonadota bacterium]
MAGQHFTVEGNRLTLLEDGPERFGALLALIDGAKRSLRILYYIYADDAAGRRVNAALLSAAARGVTVALIVDGFGSDDASDAHFFDGLQAGGVAVCRFVPRFGRRYLLRNHQKLALADAETPAAAIIVGGFNVEDDYFAPETPDAWRDLGLLVAGPAAARMAGYFDALDTWIRQPKGKVRQLNRALAQWSETEGKLRWLIGGPTRALSPWAQTVRADLRRAARIDIVAGYFTPSPGMLRRLDRAGTAHRQVRVVTAARSDNTTTIAAARFTYAGLLSKGVRVFEYAASKLHTKLYVIDDTVQIGSANFDVRSLYLNLELMLRIDDAAFAAHARAYVDGELTRSDEITAAEYRANTGWWQRLKQFAAYVLVAVIDPGVSRGMNV